MSCSTPFAYASHSEYHTAWNGTTALIGTALSRLASTWDGSAPHDRSDWSTTGSRATPP